MPDGETASMMSDYQEHKPMMQKCVENMKTGMDWAIGKTDIVMHLERFCRYVRAGQIGLDGLPAQERADRARNLVPENANLA